MWVHRQLLQTILDDNKTTQTRLSALSNEHYALQAVVNESRAQKVRDDISLDWMRHRVNALERERAVLLLKVSGISVPTPEIVTARPNTVTDLSELSFEDMGDDAAATHGAVLDDTGVLSYVSPRGR